MKLSVCIDPHRPWADIVTMARHAEELGWDTIYTCDHVDRMLDGPMTLAGLASVTERVRLGPLVLAVSVRPAALVARVAATMQEMTGGRYVLGYGASCDPIEHAAYGWPYPPLAARVRDLAAACEVVRGSAPLLVAGRSDGVLSVAARHADAWHMWGSPEEAWARSRVLDEMCVTAGRNPHEIRRVCGRDVKRLGDYEHAGFAEFIWSDDASAPVEEACAQMAAL